MKNGARELESILLTALAPMPLYFTGAMGWGSLLLFHAALGSVALATVLRRGPVSNPILVRIAAYAYIVFFAIDVILLISQDLIRPSTRLLFFIAVYLTLEAPWRKNYTKRLLVAFLIFVAAMATSTHLAVLPFVVLFCFLVFRQLIAISHETTVAQLGEDEQYIPSLRPAVFYVVAAGLIAVGMFPFLPRLGNPVVRGIMPGLQSSSTGLSDSIDFSTARSIEPDPEVVARIWMAPEAVPFFTPIRLRGTVYDDFLRGRWVRAEGPMYGATDRFEAIQIARPKGFTRTVTIQQQPQPKRRLLMPEGSYAVADLPHIMILPGDTYSIFGSGDKPVEYRVGLAREVYPLRRVEPRVIDYRIAPEVRSLAVSLAGAERDPVAVARRIEAHLSSTFEYVPDPASLGRPVSVEEFLLKERRGHCEYFAAGMVVLLTSAGIPARIVGGYYGGELNPLTGYFILRRLDAHAWVEVWNGQRWVTFDPTPATMRPGSAGSGLVKLYASALGDSVEFFWDRYILTFGTEDQVALISGALSAATEAKERVRAIGSAAARRITWQSVTVGLLLAGLALLLPGWIRRRRQSAFESMLEELRRMGIVVEKSATGAEIVGSMRASRPEVADAVKEIVELHRLERFSGRPVTAEMRAAARRALVAITVAAR